MPTSETAITPIVKNIKGTAIDSQKGCQRRWRLLQVATICKHGGTTALRLAGITKLAGIITANKLLLCLHLFQTPSTFCNNDTCIPLCKRGLPPEEALHEDEKIAQQNITPYQLAIMSLKLVVRPTTKTTKVALSAETITNIYDVLPQVFMGNQPKNHSKHS
jgi:hypothetical protein